MFNILNKWKKRKISKAETEILRLSSLLIIYKESAIKEFELGNTNRGNKLLEMCYSLDRLIEREKEKLKTYKPE